MINKHRSDEGPTFKMSDFTFYFGSIYQAFNIFDFYFDSQPGPDEKNATPS